MIRLSQDIKVHWWHRLYLVIMRPFAVISIIGFIFSCLSAFACYRAAEKVDLRRYGLFMNDADHHIIIAALFLLTWPVLFILYRAILFVVIGNKAFVKKPI